MYQIFTEIVKWRNVGFGIRRIHDHNVYMFYDTKFLFWWTFFFETNCWKIKIKMYNFNTKFEYITVMYRGRSQLISKSNHQIAWNISKEIQHINNKTPTVPQLSHNKLIFHLSEKKLILYYLVPSTANPTTQQRHWGSLCQSIKPRKAQK